MRKLPLLFALLFVAGFLAACESEHRFNGPKSDCTSGLSAEEQQCGDAGDED
jgi:hypothetical protein